MKIIIDALSQTGAGSRTYLANLLPRLGLSPISRGWIYRIFWPEGIKPPEGTADRGNLIIEPLPVPQKPALIRLLHQQLILPRLSRKADLFFAPVDVAPFFPSVEQVLAIRNPNPFYELDRAPGRALYFWIKRKLIIWSARSSKRVIFVSEQSRDHISRQIGLHMDQTRVIHHGIDHDRFHPDGERAFVKESVDPRNNKGYLLTVATITPHKNLETLLESYARLPLRLRDRHHLLIAGRMADEHYGRQMTALADQLKVSGQVSFLGEVPYGQIHTLYQGARLFILPSHLETFGHTLVEAMACGVPVIASERTAVPEILSGAGILFDPDAPEVLYDRMERMLEDQDLADQLIKRGVQRAKEFSWDKTVENLENVFKECQGL